MVWWQWGQWLMLLLPSPRLKCVCNIVIPFFLDFETISAWRNVCILWDLARERIERTQPRMSHCERWWAMAIASLSLLLTHTHIRIDVQTYRETHTLQFGSTLVTYLHTFKTFSIVVFVNFLFVLFLQVVSRLIVYSWNSRSNISDSRISLTFGRMNLCSRERFI